MTKLTVLDLCIAMREKRAMRYMGLIVRITGITMEDGSGHNYNVDLLETVRPANQTSPWTRTVFWREYDTKLQFC